MDVGALFADVPLGWSVQMHESRRYGVTRSSAAGGRVQKLYAEALDGSDVVSANLYLVGGRHVLKPCEMPAGKVVEFLEGLDGAAPSQGWGARLPSTVVGAAAGARRPTSRKPGPGPPRASNM